MPSFVANPNFDEEMAREASPYIRHEAENALDMVRRMAYGFARTRYFARSLSLQEREGHPAIHTTDNFWHLIEFGSVNNQAHAPLRRGIRAAGLRLDERNRS